MGEQIFEVDYYFDKMVGVDMLKNLKNLYKGWVGFKYLTILWVD